MYNKNFSKDPTYKQKIGQVGEDEACKFLVNKGYKVIERNYLKKWGEIDIVVKKGNRLYFIEVKSVTVWGGVTHVTCDSYSPEDNMHPWKLKRLSRVIQSYLLDRNVSDEIDWQLDLLTVYLDSDKRLVKIELLEDIVL